MQFGWTHIALLIVVTQSNLIVQSMFEGIIWFLLSTTSVICNDIMAYMFGKEHGTPALFAGPLLHTPTMHTGD